MGCGQTKDPKLLFESLVSDYVVVLTKICENNKDPNLKLSIDDVKYDVQTTNSVVSPYTGKMTYTVNAEDTKSGFAGYHTLTLAFSYRDDHWVLADSYDDMGGEGDMYVPASDVSIEAIEFFD